MAHGQKVLYSIQQSMDNFRVNYLSLKNQIDYYYWVYYNSVSSGKVKDWLTAVRDLWYGDIFN